LGRQRQGKPPIISWSKIERKNDSAQQKKIRLSISPRIIERKPLRFARLFILAQARAPRQPGVKRLLLGAAPKFDKKKGFLFANPLLLM